MRSSVWFACVVFLAAVLIPVDNLNAAYCNICHATDTTAPRLAAPAAGGLPSDAGQPEARQSADAKDNDEDALARAKGIADAVVFYRYTYRFWFHAVFETISLLVSCIGVYFVLRGAWHGLFGLSGLRNGRAPEDSLIPGSEDYSRYMRFHGYVLRGLGLLVVAEIITSVSVGINPTWQRLSVLAVIVGVRVLLGLIWEKERRDILSRVGGAATPAGSA